MPCITTVKQNRVRTISADRVDNRRNAIEPANTAIGLRQCGKITRAECIVARGAVGDTVSFAEICACNVGYNTFVAAYTDINRRLAEMNRLKLAMNIRDMDQGDVSKGFKLKKLFLAKALLRAQTRPVTKTRRTDKRGSCHADLKKIATIYHGLLSP